MVGAAIRYPASYKQLIGAGYAEAQIPLGIKRPGDPPSPLEEELEEDTSSPETPDALEVLDDVEISSKSSMSSIDLPNLADLPNLVELLRQLLV